MPKESTKQATADKAKTPSSSKPKKLVKKDPSKKQQNVKPVDGTVATHDALVDALKTAMATTVTNVVSAAENAASTTAAETMALETKTDTSGAKSTTKPARASPKSKSAQPRKVNNKPVLAKTTGINISPAKVKNIISNYVLNKQSHAALVELKNARPRTVRTEVDGNPVTSQTSGTPISQLSTQTQQYVELANREYDVYRREEYARARIAAMSAVERKAYTTAKTAARDAYYKSASNNFLDTTSGFNSEAFNTTYDSAFYANYEAAKKATADADKADEWKRAIDKVTKLKNRFSNNSRVFLSAFVEYVIKQLVHNGMVCCVADKKKIIQLSHVLDTTKAGFEERFPLYPLIVNLSTFKRAQAYLQAMNTAPAVSTPSTAAAETTDGERTGKAERDNDIFRLDGVTLDAQYQFRYYISESCRETRMDLAKTELDSAGTPMDVYNHTSVSKLFKNFCSTLVCEMLMTVGKMLLKEIDARGIKTVNDSIIGTIISHYHTVCGVNDMKTVEFIRSVTSKYYKFVSDRQQKRKGDKSDAATKSTA